MKSNIIRDSLNFDMSNVHAISVEEAKFAKKCGIPVFKGVLSQVIDEYGNEVVVNENTVVIGGGIFALQKIFGETADFIPATLNDIHSVQTSTDTDDSKTFVKLFGVGHGGCGMQFGSVVDPDFKQREIIDFIPFQVSDTAELNITNADKYYFKKSMNTGGYGWYLKEFDQPVSIKSRWKDAVETRGDGTEITGEIYDSINTNQIECYGECRITINESDIFSYWDSIGSAASSRFNTIGLFSGQKILLPDGSSEYVNVRLFSVVTFDNIPAKVDGSSTYVYRIYAAI